MKSKQPNKDAHHSNIQRKPKKLENKGTATILDNRPKMVVQRQLKSIMHNKSQVIQRAAIQNDKLNLVGETHPESEKRRESEIEYSEGEFGKDHYWLENEFVVETADGNVERFGDPIHLLILNRLTNIKLAIIEFIDIVNQLLKFENQGIEYDGHDVFKRGAKLAAMLPSSMIQAWGLLKDHPQLKKGLSFSFGKNFEMFLSNLSFKNEKGFLGLLKVWAKRAQNYEDTFHEDFYLYNKKPIREQELKEVLAGLKTMHGYFKVMSTSREKFGDNLNAYKEIDALQELFTETRIKRSNQMHEAAVAMNHKKGIWKIGELHIQDIIRSDVDTSDYNLTTEAEFDMNFPKQKKKNQGLYAHKNY